MPRCSPGIHYPADERTATQSVACPPGPAIRTKPSLSPPSLRSCPFLILREGERVAETRIHPFCVSLFWNILNDGKFVVSQNRVNFAFDSFKEIYRNIVHHIER